MKAQQLADLIGELLVLEATDPEFTDLDGSDVQVQQFEDVGIITSDAGICVQVNGTEYQLTVVKTS